MYRFCEFSISWIRSEVSSDFRFTAQFAITLRRDLEAVKLSITTSLSNGPIEGHINRLKMLKRQMYGRAGFELLKASASLGEPKWRLTCTESAEDPI